MIFYMNEDLVRGYLNFLLSSIRTYYLGGNIIQEEIDLFTDNNLKDGLIFFLFAFDKIDSKMLKSLNFVDKSGLAEYVDLDSSKTELLPKGLDLKKYLEEKIAIHVSLLEFNGIKPQYLGKITTMLRRFEKFWQTIVIFSKKRG